MRRSLFSLAKKAVLIHLELLFIHFSNLLLTVIKARVFIKESPFKLVDWLLMTGAEMKLPLLILVWLLGRVKVKWLNLTFYQELLARPRTELKLELVILIRVFLQKVPHNLIIEVFGAIYRWSRDEVVFLLEVIQVREQAWWLVDILNACAEIKDWVWLWERVV